MRRPCRPPPRALITRGAPIPAANRQHSIPILCRKICKACAAPPLAASLPPSEVRKIYRPAVPLQSENGRNVASAPAAPTRLWQDLPQFRRSGHEYRSTIQKQSLRRAFEISWKSGAFGKPAPPDPSPTRILSTKQRQSHQAPRTNVVKVWRPAWAVLTLNARHQSPVFSRIDPSARRIV